MQELVIKKTLPVLEANFEVVKQQLVDGLKTYDVIITEKTVKDGKTMAAEINKIKKAIKDQQKKALEDIMGPVDGFSDKIKELMDLADEARDKITEQVEAYEEKVKLKIQGKIEAFLLEEVTKAELREPFIKIDVLDLVKLTAVTKTGNLTTVTMTAIKGRVSEQKNLQLEEDTEIARLEQEKADELAMIKENARIEAEKNIKVHVTVAPPKQQMTQEQYPQTVIEDPVSYHEPEQTYQEPHAQINQHENTFVEALQPDYQEPIPDHNAITGEVYDTPGYMEESTQHKTVTITAEFEVDISSIPNITNDQLVNAIQKRLKAADVNNSTIVAIKRF